MATTATATTVQSVSEVAPRVWIGCLACYNAGRMTGVWVDANQAIHTTLRDVHGGRKVPAGCEETWVFDTDNLPKSVGEMSVVSASLWGEIFDEIGSDSWEAFTCWYENGCASLNSLDLPSVTEFLEAFQGEWDTFADFLTPITEELLAEWPEMAQRYFDYDLFERDMAYDYTVAPSSEGGVLVFSNY